MRLAQGKLTAAGKGSLIGRPNRGSFALSTSLVAAWRYAAMSKAAKATGWACSNTTQLCPRAIPCPCFGALRVGDGRPGAINSLGFDEALQYVHAHLGMRAIA